MGPVSTRATASGIGTPGTWFVGTAMLGVMLAVALSTGHGDRAAPGLVIAALALALALAAHGWRRRSMAPQLAGLLAALLVAVIHFDPQRWVDLGRISLVLPWLVLFARR